MRIRTPLMRYGVGSWSIRMVMRTPSEREVTMYLKAGKSRALFTVMFTGIFMASWLAGCQSMGQRNMGRLVPDFYRVAIPSSGETASETFQTRDITFQYQCRRAGDQLKVWGSGKIRFESINELIFHLYFLDDRGEVISIKNFYSFLDHSDFVELSVANRQIHRDFTIPASAVAFAIGYDGDTGKTPGTFDISFSHNPFD